MHARFYCNAAANAIIITSVHLVTGIGPLQRAIKQTYLHWSFTTIESLWEKPSYKGTRVATSYRTNFILVRI